MRRTGSILFIILNIIISAAVALAVINNAPGASSRGVQEVYVTFEVIITATPNPNAGPQVIIITATPRPEEITSLQIPDNVLEGQSQANSTRVPTLDPDEAARLGNSALPLPEGCIEYTVESGDSIAAIALEFDVPSSTMLLVNGLDEDSARGLQIGQTLIVPLEDCPVDRFIPDSVETSDNPTDDTEQSQGDSATTETPDSTATPQPTPRPTITLAPTAANAQLELSIVGTGDITTEEVQIVNKGNTVDISGWVLSDTQGNTFTFPQDRRLFSNATIAVRTSSGTNTAILLHWGRDIAVFGEPGDAVILTDTNGEVQATLRIQ